MPFNHAQASPTTAEKAYQKGDFATAQREYAAAAQRDSEETRSAIQRRHGRLQGGAVSAGSRGVSEIAFDGKPSADPKRLAAQEDAYYDLGNTLYRIGQKTEPSNPQQTIQTWEQAVKTYDAALQLRANDADAKYNRDLVQRKLDGIEETAGATAETTAAGPIRGPEAGSEKTRINRSSPARIPTKRTSRTKTRKPDASKIKPVKTPRRRTRKTKTRKPARIPSPTNRRISNKRTAARNPDQQKQPDQKGQQPKPANGQPQGNAQAQAGADQRQAEAAQAAESQREPGQMSKDEARALLDS